MDSKANTGASTEFIWGALLHMGVNMWSDIPLVKHGKYQGEDMQLLCQADHLRFDENVWRTVTGRMHDVGMNLVVIDLGEAIQYESHPELAVKGSWNIERLRKELDRLRSIGLEPIPKLNFSTAHDTWLKEYSRQVSTATYYKVCADLIKEVCEIFDTPRFFHLGYDEETAGHQANQSYMVVRQGELWWHDFMFFVKTVEQCGVRPWIWSDYYWNHPEEFLARMPKSVLQSNWYYGSSFDLEHPEETVSGINVRRYVQPYIDLDKAGFDQIPTSSNWSNDLNIGGTIDFCRKNISRERLKGFMIAPWYFTLPDWQGKLLDAVDQIAVKK